VLRRSEQRFHQAWQQPETLGDHRGLRREAQEVFDDQAEPLAPEPVEGIKHGPGISDSVHHIYLADGAERIGPPEDDFESDHVSWVPLAEVPGLISRGEISAGTTLAALLYALTRQEPGNMIPVRVSTDSARGPETTGTDRQ
jgi:hypothetical protein